MRESSEPSPDAREWPRFAAENYAGEGAGQHLWLASLVGIAVILITMAAPLPWPWRWVAIAVALPVVAFVARVVVDTVRGWRIDRHDAAGAAVVDLDG